MPDPRTKTESVNLLMVMHCHQPAGNFDSVFAEAYDKAYLPFVQVLERHPSIRLALHYSGCLFDWIAEKRPEFLETLRRLVAKGQIEMVAGGYGEPILPLVPDRDKYGQIQALKDFIKDRTGYDAKGIWLTERVWEPYLARIFSEAGLAYTIVDDSHFALAGKKVEEILGYYLTEEEGHTLAIFPSSKQLRYAMPFKLPQETIAYLRSQATPEGARAVTFGDDGEKFGLWPHTYKWVYEEGWLDNFFKALEENSGWLHVMTPSQYLEKYEPLGRIYLPCASYPEMLEWSGGYFRNFLVKYPESNWMHKRMVYASDAVSEADIKETKAAEARKYLYNAQCNCPYWHGVFGGLYLHHLRSSVYTNCINAEKTALESARQKDPLRAEVLDIDKDGFDEVILENGPLGIFVAPHEGGAILELDLRAKSLNITNTMMRRCEPYHAKIRNKIAPGALPPAAGVASIHDAVVLKEKNLDNFLQYDWHRKAFAVDHFLGGGATPESFSKAAFPETGDFASAAYAFELKKSPSAVSLELERTGIVMADTRPCAVTVEKRFALEAKKAEILIAYKIKNMTDADVPFWFGSEYNISLHDPRFCAVGALNDLGSLRIADEWFKVTLNYTMSKKAGLWYYPLETVSESESGFEKTFQQMCLLLHWKGMLKPRQSWSVEITFGVR